MFCLKIDSILKTRGGRKTFSVFKFPENPHYIIMLKEKSQSFWMKYSAEDIFFNNKNIIFTFLDFLKSFCISLCTTAHTQKKSPLHILKQCQICIYGYEFRFVCLSRICQFFGFLSRLRTLVIKVFHTYFHFWIGDLSLNWWVYTYFQNSQHT